MFKAPLAQEQVGRNPTDRGKKWQQAPPAGRRSWRPFVARRGRTEPADVSQLDQVLSSIMVKRNVPPQPRSKHLYLDAGYRGDPALNIIHSHHYIPHVASRTDENKVKKRHPGKKARRWVVEVCHGWFSRFRKLLVRSEKLERSFLALNYLAAAIIAFRKVKLKINIIYG